MSCNLWKLSKSFSKRYVPPITAASPNLPENADDIVLELSKQDSLLTQIHAEMNAGYVTKKREEQLWEVQRIITQLKRKLRSFEKKVDTQQQQQQQQPQKSMDDTIECAADMSIDLAAKALKSSAGSDDESAKATTSIMSTASNTETKTSPQQTPDVEDLRTKEPIIINSPQSASDCRIVDDTVYLHESGLLMLPEAHPEFIQLLRLQLENVELAKWQQQLQARIKSERTECIRLKEAIVNVAAAVTNEATTTTTTANHHLPIDTSDEAAANYERIVSHFLKANSLLEQKKNQLVRELFDENIELIHMQVDVAIQNFKI